MNTRNLTWPVCVKKLDKNAAKEHSWFWFCIHPFGVIYFYLCTIVWLHESFLFQIPSAIFQLTYWELHECVMQLRRETTTHSTFVLLETLKVDTKDKERRRWEVSGWNKDRKLCICCAWFHHFSQIISRQLPLTAHTAGLPFPPIRKLFFCIRAPKPLKSSCKMSRLFKQFLPEKNYKVNYKTKFLGEVLFYNVIL